MTLEAIDLGCMRGGRLVFEAISFCLSPGDGLVLRGANGSGKSTLLRLLGGFLRPLSGTLAWDGRDCLATLAEHRTRLHYIAHTDPLKNLLSLRENLSFLAAVTGGSAIDAALHAFDLTELAESPGKYLSAGQKRRCALALLVASPRPLWLLDEPGVGLDTANRKRLEELIAEHRRSGGVVVVATHGDVSVEDAFLLDLDG